VPRSCRYKSSVKARPVEEGRLLPPSVEGTGGSRGGGRAGAWPAEEEGGAKVVLPCSVGAMGSLASGSIERASGTPGTSSASNGPLILMCGWCLGVCWVLGVALCVCPCPA